MTEQTALLDFINNTLLAGKQVEIGPETMLFQQRLLDSMNILYLIGYVENRLGRRLTDNDRHVQLPIAPGDDRRLFSQQTMSANQFDVLERAGFQSDGANGVLLSGHALLLRDSWVAFVTAFLRRFSTEYFAAPLFIAEETLVRAGYLDHFPQNVFTASSYQGAGPAQFIAPAACLHLYPRLSRYDYSEGPFVGFVQAHCARYEGGKWQFPFRMSEFHMAELVIVGGVSLVERIYRQVQEELVSELQRLRLPGELNVATDAFFLGSDDGARIMQKLKELKKEYVVNCAGQDVALASLNKHESYFATRFVLKAADGRK